MSFRGVHKWVLPEGPGLYFLTGRNDDNPRLEREGVGKSSLLNAISWCLTGWTTRTLRGNDVVNRNADSCYVLIEAKVGTELFHIKTTQNPNSLTVNGDVVDRKTLADLIRLNHEALLYSVIIPQFGSAFLDQSPGQKLTLFSSIMDLDYWLEKSEAAKERAEQIENKKILCEKDVSQLLGRIESINSIIKDLKVKSETWTQEQANKVEQSRIQSALQASQIESNKLEITALNKNISSFEDEIQILSAEVVKHNSLVRDLDIEIFDIEKELGIVEHKVRLLNDDERRLEKVGATCPTCKQKVDKQHFEREMSKIVKSRAVLDKDKKELIEAKKEVLADKNKIGAVVSAAEMKLSNIKFKSATAKGNRDTFIREINYSEREIARIETDLKKIKNQKNEFLYMIEEKNIELGNIHKQISSFEFKIKTLNEEYAAIHYWVSGFKRLRLFIIEETLQTLEIEVNNNLAALGLADWKIEFDTERENKSGGITKGFIALIKDSSGEIAKYESLSGGEGQRTKLAGTFGFADLIMERTGLTNKIEFYDEISQHMSNGGITDTLNILRDRAIAYDRTIIVVDHHALNYADFAGIITVIKDENGSRIS
jgi:DNA repair exonuclease SbcCD ATPase subunit